MRDGRGIGFTGCTEGWYNCAFHAYCPDFLFMDDPDFEREVADLYRRDRIGEALGGTATPVP